MRIIVTGGLGFIGSNLIKKLLNYKNNIILNLDSESYCSMPESLKKIKTNKNYFYRNIDLSNFSKLNKIISNFKPNIIFHLAAESHVDNSIKNANNFIYSNIIGTYNLLECCNNLNSLKNFKFIHISTDEVYGSLNNKRNKSFSENSKFLPNSPYSASKAASDLLVRAWNKTYNIPTITTNCVNNFGEWQFPEKLIPVVISCCLLKKEIPVYGDGQNIREWIYVNDHVYQLIEISKKGIVGETYNIGSGYEISNINLIVKICNYFDKNYKSKNSYHDLITFVKDRPAHDFRYSLNSSKVNNLLFLKKMKNFDIYLEKTIDWYVQNSKWLLNKYYSKK